jgi:hypothetical protein
MAFRFRAQRSPIKISLPSFPSTQATTEPEQLTGVVQGLQASAPEERFAKALDRHGVNYKFRTVVGAPKGMPGWKELDFLILSGGLLYASEVDTAFTHRKKQYADVLHDAIILNDKEIQSYGQLYPQVRHVDGDSDLSSQELADAYVQKNYSKSTGAAPTPAVRETMKQRPTTKQPARKIDVIKNRKRDLKRRGEWKKNG